MSQDVQPQEQQMPSDMTTSWVVAIVDDDPQICAALSDWLGLHNLRFAQHPSGESFLRALHRQGGKLAMSADMESSQRPIVLPLAAVILDVNLPGITGFDLAKTLRQWDPKLHVVIITALAEEDHVRYGTPPPGIFCLKKPFDLDRMEEVLFRL
jgi:DNA-binding response OmpR family regulator